MADIFVSYSRKNSDFARRLAGELKQHEYDLWVDWEDIPPTVDWSAEIEKGIEEAAAFIFIVSPDSIASKVCKQEIDCAVKNGKRLIPVAPIEVKWDDAPREVSRLNYIFFRESDDFAAACALLITALKTDYAWLDTHRRLQMKALEWERGSKNDSFLLHGVELENTEGQILANATKNPHPTELQGEYVLKSKQVATRQRRKTIGALTVIIGMLLVIIGVLVTPLILEAIAKTQAVGELIYIPAGVSKFGTDDKYMTDRGSVPFLEIPLNAFYIGKYEVTNAQYKLCVDYGNCAIPLDQSGYKDPKMQDYPVVYVTLFQANNYCQWVGLRLLNEMEWERAARGPEGEAWPWGDKYLSPELVNMPGPDTDDATAGLQAANSNLEARSGEKVYNLVGNAWEWTSSYLYLGGDYDRSYWDGTSDNFKGTAFYATRGGGWSAKIAYITKNNPDVGTDVSNELGIRCGKDVQ